MSIHYVGFKGMDFHIGFSDGVSGRSYNEDANSTPYDHGFRRGRLQRHTEHALGIIVAMAMGVTLTLGWFL